jgi:hypothetical protein
MLKVLEYKVRRQVIFKSSIDCTLQWIPARQVLIRHLVNLTTLMGGGQIKYSRSFPVIMDKFVF